MCDWRRTARVEEEYTLGCLSYREERERESERERERQRERDVWSVWLNNQTEIEGCDREDFFKQ